MNDTAVHFISALRAGTAVEAELAELQGAQTRLVADREQLLGVTRLLTEAVAPPRAEDSTLYMCNSEANGILVTHERWTPILNFARAFPAEYARALATRSEGDFTARQIELL